MAIAVQRHACRTRSEDRIGGSRFAAIEEASAEPDVVRQPQRLCRDVAFEITDSCRVGYLTGIAVNENDDLWTTCGLTGPATAEPDGTIRRRLRSYTITKALRCIRTPGAPPPANARPF